MAKFKTMLVLCALLPLAMARTASAEPGFDLDFKAMSDLACKDDVKKFCADVKTDKKSACLKERSKDLTPECKGARMALDFLKSTSK